ncbi:MAG: hypothetical protein LC778_13660 [Acidobacteria bacterium]|nr:hypothetical protein [Acidobacteriota bacterium]
MNSKLKIKNSKLNKSLSYLCLSVFICSLFFLNVFAQNDGSLQNQTGRAGTFAITNARIVTVSGTTIENGTVECSRRRGNNRC